MFNKHVLRVALACSAAVLVACGSDSPSAPPAPTIYPNPIGAYDVSTVNAKPLPVAIFADTDYTYEVVGGTFWVSGDGTYSTRMTFRQTVAGKVDLFVDSTGGTWTQSGTLLSFTNAQDQSADQATWANTGGLTFVEAQGKGSNTYVYKLRPIVIPK